MPNKSATNMPPTSLRANALALVIAIDANFQLKRKARLGAAAKCRDSISVSSPRGTDDDNEIPTLEDVPNSPVCVEHSLAKL
ncbi:hypothetical protein B0H14DRAFT_3433168 [Mycena olivaceomarginata]|nr:hypothetical protein B0H14DRAFT_3433168 [Mycena olivaceomarginata]